MNLCSLGEGARLAGSSSFRHDMFPSQRKRLSDSSFLARFLCFLPYPNQNLFALVAACQLVQFSGVKKEVSARPEG